MTRTPLVPLALALVLAGCAARGPVDDVIGRRLTWFSYVGAEDIAARCRPGNLPEYRLVYNARWDEQVRSYDIAGGVLQARVFSGRLTTQIGLDDPFRSVIGRRADRPMSAGDLAALDQALADSGFEQPAPAGLRLRADAFFWTAAACRDGTFTFNAWQSPDPGFAGIRFDRVLFALDDTGEPVNPARPVLLRPEGQPVRHDGDGGPDFVIEVARNGVLSGRLFP